MKFFRWIVSIALIMAGIDIMYSIFSTDGSVSLKSAFVFFTFLMLSVVAFSKKNNQ